ncbi:MAG: HAD hydrolase-like protein [Bacteroidales bacterium]
MLCRRKSDIIAFDFDGTLVRADVRQKEVLRVILLSSAFNIKTVNLDKWWAFKREGLNTQEALIECKILNNYAVKIASRWKDLIEENEWLSFDSIKEGVYELFNEIKNNEKRIIILTARKLKYNFFVELNRLFYNNNTLIDDVFIVNPENTVTQKAKILEKYKPNIYIGDTEKDYYSAQKAKINFIALADGQRNQTFLKSCGVNTVLKNFSELNLFTIVK